MSVAQKLILFLTQNHFCLLLVKDKMWQFEDLKIVHETISWSDRLEYLDAHFKSGRTLLVDNETVISEFYAAANATYNHVKFASEVTETFCVPLLSYA